jgi:hypothetical protein
MTRVQKVVHLAGDDGRRHSEDGGLAVANPTLGDLGKREQRRERLPAGRKIAGGKALATNAAGNDSADGDEIARRFLIFETNKVLERGQRQRRGGVDGGCA